MSSHEKIPVGLLHSLSGGLAVTERSIQQGALLAIEQVNAAGGVGGRQLVPAIEDYRSDCALARASAERLLRDGVRICLGGYTSASRVAMLPAFREHDALLLFPTFFEGLESDDHVLYTGAVPNQFLIDYVDWILERLGDRLYVVGSDYVFPRALGAMLQRLVDEAGGSVLGERYVPLGSTDFRAAVDDVERLRPQVVVSSVVGSDSIPAFHRQLRGARRGSAELPVATTAMTEIEVQAMGAEHAAGAYATGAYFGSLEDPANRAYVDALRARFGPGAVPHAPQVAAYNAIRLLALAAERSDDLSPAALRSALAGTTFDASPEGAPIAVHESGLTDHPCFVGRARLDGSFEVLARFGPRAPDAYPPELVAPSRRPLAQGGP
jgi:urea transport system substrate-binding protein